LIFLDGDDLLLPHTAATIADIWTPATVKVQLPLATIDKAGRQIGHIAPKYPPNLDTATIRKELLRTGGSPNSAGSGNAYSRSLLAPISADSGFEIENSRDHHMDAVLECNAPFYGEVVTLYEPLSCYRVHDSNIFAMNSIENAYFAIKCRTFELKVDYLAGRCKVWESLLTQPLPATVRSGCASADSPRRELPGDQGEEPIFTTLGRAISACIDAPLPLVNRMLRMAWFVSTAMAPRPLARWLIAFRFIPIQRSRIGLTRHGS
jgi:hypothetical protein